MSILREIIAGFRTYPPPRKQLRMQQDLLIEIESSQEFKRFHTMLDDLMDGKTDSEKREVKNCLYTIMTDMMGANDTKRRQTNITGGK